MRNRFHEPPSDTPSPRRLDDVNAQQVTIRATNASAIDTLPRTCQPPPDGGPAAQIGGRETQVRSRAARREPDQPRQGRDAGTDSPAGPGRGRRVRQAGPGGQEPGPLTVQDVVGAAGAAERLLSEMQAIRDTSGTAGRAAARAGMVRFPVTWAKAITVVTGWAAWPCLAGHVRLAGNLEHRNPSASDIHPRNRTPVGNVSLATDDAIQDHRTGPGAIPRNKEGKD